MPADNETFLYNLLLRSYCPHRVHLDFLQVMLQIKLCIFIQIFQIKKNFIHIFKQNVVKKDKSSFSFFCFRHLTDFV